MLSNVECFVKQLPERVIFLCFFEDIRLDGLLLVRNAVVLKPRAFTIAESGGVIAGILAHASVAAEVLAMLITAA